VSAANCNLGRNERNVCTKDIFSNPLHPRARASTLARRLDALARVGSLECRDAFSHATRFLDAPRLHARATDLERLHTRAPITQKLSHASPASVRVRASFVRSPRRAVTRATRRFGAPKKRLETRGRG